MLQDNSLDIALIRTDNDPDQVRYSTLLTEEIVALLPEDHHLAQHQSVSLEMFCQQPLVLFREGYFLRDVISQYEKKHKLKINLQFETNLIELLKKMVVKEVGISTCLPCALDGSESLITRSFLPPITLSLGIGWKSNHYLSTASRAFIDFMQQEIGKV
ncbi:LysR family transcriptional regulator substrate-binding protein [Endozoicomonas sp. SCSIO W0465]|uniref:LysR family transcriptional regulator substrate-binding protein n=1 Tax=Endozoicomonas sp. SCSIO W0465 TaxID=2918516 RepID=UPI0020760EA2|nr:LysR family transcriptional regulator substrate-binding protein [Endozoicomonas sp. SCSIO W0465]USE38560.1 LysR family transcriptional regulator substrate-binding protein [Endozoicomonas sp. SCSIO W0465]